MVDKRGSELHTPLVPSWECPELTLWNDVVPVGDPNVPKSTPDALCGHYSDLGMWAKLNASNKKSSEVVPRKTRWRRRIVKNPRKASETVFSKWRSQNQRAGGTSLRPFPSRAFCQILPLGKRDLRNRRTQKLVVRHEANGKW